MTTEQSIVKFIHREISLGRSDDLIASGVVCVFGLPASAVPAMIELVRLTMTPEFDLNEAREIMDERCGEEEGD